MEECPEAVHADCPWVVQRGRVELQLATLEAAAIEAKAAAAKLSGELQSVNRSVDALASALRESGLIAARESERARLESEDKARRARVLIAAISSGVVLVGAILAYLQVA